MKKEEQQQPPGMKKFLETLKEKVHQAGTVDAWFHCEKCNVPVSLGKMNVFVYPDEPEYTTKALCYKCMQEEYYKHHVPLNN